MTRITGGLKSSVVLLVAMLVLSSACVRSVPEPTRGAESPLPSSQVHADRATEQFAASAVVPHLSEFIGLSDSVVSKTVRSLLIRHPAYPLGAHELWVLANPDGSVLSSKLVAQVKASDATSERNDGVVGKDELSRTFQDHDLRQVGLDFIFQGFVNENHSLPIIWAQLHAK